MNDDPLFLTAYYFSFEPTGCEPVDRILEAVCRAGKAYHHTEMWNDPWDDDEPSEQSKIQAAADRAAEQQRYDDAIHAEVESLRKQRNWLVEQLTDDSRYTPNMTGDEVREADYCRNVLFKFERTFGTVVSPGDGQQ